MAIEQTFNTFEDWQQKKSGVKFNYFTLDFDTQPESVKRILQQKRGEIEEIILERAEPFWRNVFGPDGFDSETFPYGDVWVRFRAFANSPTACRVDLRSIDYDKACEKIRGEFFPEELKRREGGRMNEYLLGEVMRFANEHKLIGRDFPFEVVNPSFSADKLVDALGEGLDPKIKDLIDILNKLGLYTTMSCEGHSDRGFSYPWIDFAMVSLPKCLSMFSSIEDQRYQRLILKVYKDGYQLNPSEEMSLEEGQELFKELEEEIRKRIKK